MTTVFSTATQMGAAIGAGTTTSRQLYDMFLAQIAAHNPALNAIVAQRASSSVYPQCDAADARALAGTRLSPIDGVPFTVKMALATAGLMTGNVNASNYAASPVKNSDIVGKLLAAGGILTGKTNMGISPSQTISSGYAPSGAGFGTTKNPYNTAYHTGGSAGGSACAVAAGMTGFDIAIDTAGSIRIPSAICGVYGLAPTNGLVSNRGDWSTDMPSMPPSDLFDLDKYGPVTRGLGDLQMILGIIAGPTQLRPGTPRLFPSTSPTLNKIRSIKFIGPWTCNFQSQIDAILAAQSCVVDTSSPTISWYDQTVFNNVYGGFGDTAQLPAWFAANIGRNENPYYGAQIPYGITFASKTYQAKAHAVWLSALVASLFGDTELVPGDVNVLAMGTVALSPPLIGGAVPASIAYMAYTSLFNITGNPCVTLRAGTDPATGLPIGIMLVGRPGYDLDLLGYAAQITGLPGFIAPTL